VTALLQSDLLLKVSTTSGAAGNTTAQAAPSTGSLGKYISTTPLAAVSLANLFPATVTISEVVYRCIFVYNNTSSGNTLQGAVVYLLGGDPSGGATVTIAVDPTAASPIGSAAAQAGTTSGSSVPTTTPAFATPTSVATGLSLGDIPPGYCKAIWIKRVSPATMPVPGITENITLAVSGATGA
jgi:hypothetical protein